MRLLVISDVHLEKDPDWFFQDAYPDYDVLVIAGDLCHSILQGIQYLLSLAVFKKKPIVYVAGNHEFYGGIIEDRLAEVADRSIVGNVHFLFNNSVVIDGVKFIGTTLWSDFDLNKDVKGAMATALERLNDYRFTHTRIDGIPRLITPPDLLRRHQAARRFIASELSAPFDGKRVVVTHHAPHRLSVHPRFVDHPANASFVSDLSDVLSVGRPELWIHGHCHDSFNYDVYQTKIVCSPKGYGPGGSYDVIENAFFDPEYVVDI